MQNRVIAATKLTIPPPMRVVVARPELVGRLEDDSYCVAIVSAPAGFAKTALLADWAGRHRDETAWLSCDAGDAEPTRFWRGLLLALSTKWPGVGDDAAFVLERLGSDDPDLAVSVANDLGELGRPVVVVIDDLHLARPAPGALAGLVDALPPNVRLVIGSRHDPPFPLARLRVAGRLLELRSDELRFGAEETATLLAANGVETTSTELARLHDLIEGWPAGVQLAALSLQRVGDRSGFLDAFATTDRAVTDFLVNEVLDQQPVDRVEFLYETSVLESFDVDLCEQVTGRDDAAEVLADLVADNLFLVPLDDSGLWYRYHHLFGAFLRARLRARSRAALFDAHRRAGEVLEARGDVIGAIDQAVAVDDVDRAATLVRAFMGRWLTVHSGQTAAVARHWLHAKGAEQLRSDPETVVEIVLALIASSGADDAVHWLERVLAVHGDGPGDLTAYTQGVWAEHHLHRGETEQGLIRAHLAVDAISGRVPDRRLYPLMHTMHARAHLDDGDLDTARDILDAEMARPGGHPAVVAVRQPGLRSWIAFVDGDLMRAERLAAAAMRCADDLTLDPDEPGRVYAAAALGGVLAERGDDDGAGEVLDQAHLAIAGGRPPIEAVVLLQRAAVARAACDEDDAHRFLDQARVLLPRGSGAWQRRFGAEAARQALCFRGAAAGTELSRLGDLPVDILVEAALARDDRAGALDLLDAAPPARTTREVVERGVLAAFARPDVESSNGDLAAALTAAQPERYLHTIVRHGRDAAKLLAALTPDVSLQPYVESLIEAADAVVAPARAPIAITLVEPLSAREVTVLRYLSSRLTNQEIAAALYVSLNTLKSHVKAVYRKLGVSSRAEAVMAGRQAGLI